MVLPDLPQIADPTTYTSWHRLSSAAGGLPDWLPRTALADKCTRELLVIARLSATADHESPGCAALLARLVAAGFFNEGDGDAARSGGIYTLRPEVRRAMLSELDRQERPRAVLRADLLLAALGQPACGLGVQLAVWAYEARDWTSLEKIWVAHPASELVSDPRSRAAYSLAPNERRSELPGLSYAAALTSAYDPQVRRVDLDQITTALLRDGRTLHSHWAHNESAEAQVIAGTMWMMAEATIEDAADDPRLEGPLATYDQVSRVLQEASLAGSRLSARALTFFHATASLLALLRADWTKARREAELGMILSDTCSFPGFLAALVAATSSSVSGNTQYFLMGDAFLARHAAHDCEVVRWIEPGFHLAWADAATRRLDREVAEEQLRLHEVEGASTRWFNIQPVQALIKSTAATIWHDPERALAEFDSIIAESSLGADLTTPWGQALLRARAELLLSLGAIATAERVIADLLEHATDSVSAVPAARLFLAAGDFDRAVAKADEGIFSMQLSLADRAQLYALKAAALELAGAPADQVGRAAAAACVVCEQAATLVPFAVLPDAVRSVLVADHERHHGSVDCFVSRARQRGAFDGLQECGVTHKAAIKLTRREEVLLPLLATSATVQEIANQQFVSVNTVRKQVVSMREKLGAASRGELIRRAHELRLLELPMAVGRSRGDL